MGAWNTSLYGNDTARDVKGDYVHKLRSGKNDQEAMEAMLVEYERTKDRFSGWRWLIRSGNMAD